MLAAAAAGSADTTTYPVHPIESSSGSDSHLGACLKPLQAQPTEGRDTAEAARGGIAAAGSGQSGARKG